ncbi:hypothetical protein [Bradyrhizobium betae]|uniref:Glycosyltransferase RgtA/B/C/D-like domain-containing protein n=1 Tax=Bradyrhizobium betae TaxID=244734 RepID=A0A4Q1V2Z8_9BRAD|nr:hypothetical protein [Bradyrhizobium betae]RXT44806.1 hypothetical protein B5V03_19645 [Bradyrhizobium betae]
MSPARWFDVPRLFAFALTAVFIFHFAGFVDHAYPSLVDDHDIIAPLGSATTAPLADVLKDLKDTDDFQALSAAGNAERFRPAHYPLKSLQIYFFGSNFRIWYIATFAMYVATATVLFSLLYRRFGLAVAGLFAVLYLGHRAWSDILPRLGPVEIDCILIGTVLIWLCWHWIDEGKRWLILLAAPVALLYGAAKEPNSVFLLAIGGLLVVCAALVQNRRMAIAGAIQMVCGAIVMAVLLKTTPSAQSSIISPGNGLTIYLRQWHHDPTAWMTIVLLATLAIAEVQRKAGALDIGRRELAALLIATLSIEALRFTIFYLSFTATYDGYIDAISTRYGYPIFVMTSVVAAILLGRLSLLGAGLVRRRITVLALACAFALTMVNQGLFARKTLVSRDAWQTFNVSAEMAVQKVAAWMKEKRLAGDNPQLVVTGPSLEWEPRLSLIMFFRHRMPDTPVYFDPKQPSLKPAVYLSMSIRYGGHPMPAKLDPANCIDAHVDTKPYQSNICQTSLTVTKPD